MNEHHRCFDELVEETESDATFEKAIRLLPDSGKLKTEWVVNLYHYTPSLNISKKRGLFIMNFCPICGKTLVYLE